MSVGNRRVGRTLWVGAFLAAAFAAALVPASDGDLLPAGLVLLAVTAQALRRRTSSESRRA